MPNPIMSLLGMANPVMQTVGQMIEMVKMAKDPQAAITQMAQSDDRMKQVMEVVNQNGGDAKAAFYNMAKQKGVNPDDIINQVKSLM